jgi:hypothetical protein
MSRWDFIQERCRSTAVCFKHPGLGTLVRKTRLGNFESGVGVKADRASDRRLARRLEGQEEITFSRAAAEES